MARSLIGGLIQKGLPAEKIKVSEPVAVLAEGLAKDFSVATFSDNSEAASTGSNIWVFAVKPQVMKSVCQQLSPLAQSSKPLIISIAAGITSQQLDKWLGGNLPIVRIMPNTPALLGAGASGLFANEHVDTEQKQHAQDLMQATGITVWIENENLMDAVTAVSGSGPAYVFPAGGSHAGGRHCARIVGRCCTRTNEPDITGGVANVERNQRARRCFAPTRHIARRHHAGGDRKFRSTGVS